MTKTYSVTIRSNFDTDEIIAAMTDWTYEQFLGTNDRIQIVVE